MRADRLSPRLRAIGLGIVVVLTMLTSYVVLAGEHSAALDAFVVRDPTLSFVASRSAAPSGTVIHLDGARSSSALAEFSGDGFLAYSPIFLDSTGAATVVPPLFAGNTLAAGDTQLRLLVKTGPVWTSSAKTAFSIEAPAPASGPAGAATLFALEVTRGLLLHAEKMAAAAADAGAPSATATFASSLAELRVETEALAAGFEAVAAGKSGTVARSGLVIDATGIRLMDQLMASYITSLGPASPSPCGDRKDAEARSGLSAQTIAAMKAAATLFVSSLVDCDSPQVREIAERTTAWLSGLGYSMAQALLTIPEFPKLVGLLLITVASWGDEATSATHLWREYELGANLRLNMLRLNASFALGDGQDLYVMYDGKKVRLPDYLRTAAEQDTYLSSQIERLRRHRAIDEEMLQAVTDWEDEAAQARVAQALEARQSTPTTPPPTTPPPTTPPPTTPPPTTAPPTAAPPTATPAATVRPTLVPVSLPPTPAALSYSLIAPPQMTAGKAISFSFCAPTPSSATALCGPGSTNPKGGNPPYTFTYGTPRPFGLMFNSNGLVTGTPADASAGSYSFQVCVKDLSGASVCRTVGATVAAAATPQPAACAGTAYAGTTWAGPVSTSGYSTTVTFTFGQPTLYASGCTVPIASVRTSDATRVWALNTSYPYNYGQFNELTCDPSACTDFTFTIEQTSGPPICSTCTPPDPPAKLIINAYGSPSISATTISGNAGTGSSAGGCCAAGTFTLTKR